MKKNISVYLLTIVFCSSIYATNFTWNAAGGGAWTTAGNWTPGGGPPDANADEAIFDNTVAIAGDVTVGSTFTVRQIHIDSSPAYTIADSGSGILRMRCLDTQSPQINITNVNGDGAHNIDVELQLFQTAGSNDFEILQGSTGTLDISGQITTDGSDIIFEIVKSGAGTLSLSGTANNDPAIAGDCNINAGTLELNKSSSAFAIARNPTFGISFDVNIASGATVQLIQSEQIQPNTGMNISGLFDLNGLDQTFTTNITVETTGSITTGAGTLSIDGATLRLNGTSSITGNLEYTDSGVSNALQKVSGGGTCTQGNCMKK